MPEKQDYLVLYVFTGPRFTLPVAFPELPSQGHIEDIIGYPISKEQYRQLVTNSDSEESNAGVMIRNDLYGLIQCPYPNYNPATLKSK